MTFSKTLLSGKYGSVTATESAGKVSLALSGSFSVGGGEAAGILTGNLSGGLTLPAVTLANLVFDLIESKSPAGVVIIEKEMQAAAIAALQAY